MMRSSDDCFRLMQNRTIGAPVDPPPPRCWQMVAMLSVMDLFFAASNFLPPSDNDHAPLCQCQAWFSQYGSVGGIFWSTVRARGDTARLNAHLAQWSGLREKVKQPGALV
jgi:hypothetical protein